MNFINLPLEGQLEADKTNGWKVGQIELFYRKEWKTAARQNPHHKFVSVSARKQATQAAMFLNIQPRQRLKRGWANKSLVFISPVQVFVYVSFSLPQHSRQECVCLHRVYFIVAGRSTPPPLGHRSTVTGTRTRPIKPFQQKLQTFLGFQDAGSTCFGASVYLSNISPKMWKKRLCGSVWGVSIQYSVFVRENNLLGEDSVKI